MKDLTLAFTIIIKGCIANKMTPEQMASQLNEHVQHEVKNLNIPAVVGRSEQFICRDCGKDTVEWLDGLCEDCTLKGFK